jgi:hypothetical protein
MNRYNGALTSLAGLYMLVVFSLSTHYALHWFSDSSVQPLTSVTSSMGYTRKQLKDLNNNAIVSLDTLRNIKELNLQKRRRGRRAGSRRHMFTPGSIHTDDCKSYTYSANDTSLHNDSSIPVITSSRRPRNHHRDQHQPGSVKSNLIQIDIQPTTQVKTNQVKLSLVNTRSIRNKVDDYMEHLSTSNIDVSLITETWMSHMDTQTIAELKSDSYDFDHVPRLERMGGGLAIHWKKEYTVKRLKDGKHDSFDYAEWKLTSQARSVVIILVYHAPYSTVSPVTNTMFLEEFAEYLAEITTDYLGCDYLIAGDFNIHMDDHTDSTAHNLQDILECNGLVNHVEVPTHEAGHILDLIITRKDSKLLDSKPEATFYISDHSFIEVNLCVETIKRETKVMKVRKWKTVNMEEVKSILSNSELCTRENWDNLDELAEVYNQTLTEIADEMAPLKNKRITVRETMPWYTPRLKEIKSIRRMLEKKWLKTGLKIYFEQFKYHRSLLKKELIKEKKKYYSDIVLSCEGNIKDLYSFVNHVTGASQTNPLPEGASGTDLCNNFANYFTTKISKIKDEIKRRISNDHLERSTPKSTPRNTGLSQFEIKCEEHIKKHIMNMPTKSCELDPVPTWVVKACIDQLARPLTHMVNLSLQQATFLHCWKRALVKPIIKKPSGEKTYDNYRPVSNLEFVSKVVESCVTKELTAFLETNSLLPVHTSAYRKQHSTETAVLKVAADILKHMDSQEVTALLLIDMSAAFDTVDEVILADVLEKRMGITGSVLDWIRSYMNNRRMVVSAGGYKSDEFQLHCGVPQGSTLGPILFLVYMAPLYDLFNTMSINSHGYADDTQLYQHFKAGSSTNVNRAKEDIESCVSFARDWITVHELKINDSKTELIVLGTSKQLTKLEDFTIKVGQSEIHPKDSVRNLGLHLDSKMNMISHINKTTSKCYASLHKIGGIRSYLTTGATQVLVQSLVMSHIDYGNSVLNAVADVHLKKLQRVQNTAARMVKQLRRDCSITPVLQDLHWLPVAYRVKFKMVMLTFKALKTGKPQYLRELLVPYTPSRSLRSENKNLLQVPFVKLQIARRSFYYAAPVLWNSLPQELRDTTVLTDFKNKLKCHFFKQAFYL